MSLPDRHCTEDLCIENTKNSKSFHSTINLWNILGEGESWYLVVCTLVDSPSSNGLFQIQSYTTFDLWKTQWSIDNQDREEKEEENGEEEEEDGQTWMWGKDLDMWTTGVGHEGNWNVFNTHINMSEHKFDY